MGPSLETLLLELYQYRVAAQHTPAGDVIHPFENVPKRLMHELDREYLLLKANEDIDEDDIDYEDNGICLDL